MRSKETIVHRTKVTRTFVREWPKIKNSFTIISSIQPPMECSKFVAQNHSNKVVESNAISFISFSSSIRSPWCGKFLLPITWWQWTPKSSMKKWTISFKLVRHYLLVLNLVFNIMIVCIIFIPYFSPIVYLFTYFTSVFL